MTDTPTVEPLVKHMAERFLAWKLPENFNPDNGIVFYKAANIGTEHQYYREPTGTNLFDYTQAKAMVEYMLEGASLTQQPRPDASVDGLADELEEYAGEFGSQQTGALPPELRDRILAVLTTREAVVEEVDLGAINALRLCQQQLDEDGVFVGVSRQALDQLLDWFDRVTEDAAAAIRALAAKEVE